MSTLHETIREWLIAYDPIWGHENMADALRAVLDIHKPYRIYDDCGHDHPQTDVKAGRAVEAREVGYVCEDGYEYLICTACCCTGHVGYLSQTEECATDHPHGKDLPYCGTVRVIAAALGVAEPAQPARQWAVEHPSWDTVAHHSIGSAVYTLDHAPLGNRARLVTRMSDQTEWVPCGRDGEPVSARPRSCGLYVGPGQNCIEPVEVDGKCRTHAAQDTADVPAWARRHPHKTPAQRLLEASTEPAQAEPRVWRVTAVPDGIDTAEIGTLHRERDGRWESWYDDGDGDDADWYPSAWTGKARMEHYGYTLAEVTDQAGEAR